jgi:hypothetical protein
VDIVRELGRTEDPTGLLFRAQTVEAVKDAVELFEASASQIRAEACRENAQRFSTERFRQEIAECFAACLKMHPELVRELEV